MPNLAFVFANGSFAEPAYPLDPGQDDLIIAADGGSQHCQDLGLLPDVVVGDLDSADPGLIAAWQEAGVEIIRYPEDKDQTDLELSLLLAQERGAERIKIFGAVGGRLDMTFGNLTLLAHPDLRVPAVMICGNQEIHVLKPGDQLNLEGVPGDTLSLIPLQPASSRITASGLAYPLRNESLVYGTTRGISNRFVDRQVQIQLDTGLLAIVHTRTIPLKED